MMHAVPPRLSVRLAMVWGLVLWLACAADAQPVPLGAVGAADADTPSHAWLVIERRGGPFLLHIPPREIGSGHEAAEPGSVRPVRPLVEWPDAIAAISDRVYLFYPPEPDGEAGASWRPVFSLRAVPSAIAGMWVDLPTGLMDSLPSLPARGRLVGVGVHQARLYLLERSAGYLGLWALDTDTPSSEWFTVPVPSELSETEPSAIAVWSHRDGLSLAARDADDSRAWLLSPAGAWRSMPLIGWDRFWSAHWRGGFGREVLAATTVVPPEDRAADDQVNPLELWRLSESEPISLGVLEDARPGAIAVLPAPGRVVLIRPGVSSEDGQPPPPIGVFERSLLTGRTLHDGPSAGAVAVPVNELRVIAIILVLMMAAVLIVIIRPNPEHAWSVPDGWVLSDPGRRMIASLIDLIVTALVVAPAFGVTARQVLTLEVLIHPGGAWLSLPALIVTGWIGMSVWEALLGLTPGKFVTGCRVRRAIPGPGVKVSLFWCLVRNAMKWLTPPVAAIALFDPEGRHRGDAAARAVVVSRPAGQGRP